MQANHQWVLKAITSIKAFIPTIDRSDYDFFVC